MSLTPADVEKVARLARLSVNPKDMSHYTHNLSNILHLVDQMNAVDTAHIEPMAHPQAATQRLRLDEVTEPNQRELFQKIAPQVEAGLYLVPQVIEE